MAAIIARAISSARNTDTTHAVLGLEARMKPEAIHCNHRCFL
jgi:hypothetical protein